MAQAAAATAATAVGSSLDDISAQDSTAGNDQRLQRAMVLRLLPLLVCIAAAAETTSGLVVASASDSTGTLTGVDATLDTGDASRDDRTKDATRASRLAQAAGSMLRRGGGGGGGLDGAAFACMRLMRSAVVGAACLVWLAVGVVGDIIVHEPVTLADPESTAAPCTEQLESSEPPA